MFLNSSGGNLSVVFFHSTLHLVMSLFVICIFIFSTKALHLFSSTFGTMQSSSTTSHSFINTSCPSWSNTKNHPPSSLLSNPTLPFPISLMILCISSSSKSGSHFLLKMLIFWATNLWSVTLNIPISFHMVCILFLYPLLLYSFWDHFLLVVFLFITSGLMMTRPILLTNETLAEQETFTWSYNHIHIIVDLLLFDILTLIRGLLIFRLHYHLYFYWDTISR